MWSRLEAAGLSDARVRVEYGGGRTAVDIQATDPKGGGFEAELRHEAAGDGDASPPLAIELPDFSEFDHLPLPERRAAIEKRLREMGIDATVTVDGGRIGVETEAHRKQKNRRRP